MNWIALFGIFVALVNVYYLISKDNIQKGEAEIKECADTLKKALQDMLDGKKNCKAHIAYIEGLAYLRLVKENELDGCIMRFSRELSDFYEGSRGEEDLIGSYKSAVDAVYNMKFSICEYLAYTFKQRVNNARL